ncbi:MAG TPA: MarR family transcriptional regulator [Patescibacteria group bacterium]|nr:MarR family transcriptional regulator [Patescibacteria group bacterium]
MGFDLQDSLGFIIRKTSGKIKSEMQNRFRPWDITPEQWVFIHFLGDQDGLSPQQLSDISHKDRANTLRIIDKLQRKELVTRRPCTKDRRVSHIFLTERGRRIREELEAVIRKMQMEAMAGIDLDRISELKQVLHRMLQNFG